MLFKGSDYETVPLFEPDEAGHRPFRGLLPRPLRRVEPVLEHSIALKDRLDALAQHYYADPRAWRFILEADAAVLFPEDLLFDPEPAVEHGTERVGEVVLIPRRGTLG